MNLRSDWQCLGAVLLYGHESLGQRERYKACVASAVHGGKLPLEDALSREERILLEARRALFKGDSVLAIQLLEGPEISRLEPSLEGDRQFLLGTLTQRAGSFSGAKARLHEASKSYLEGDDFHRFLRNRINEKLCEESLSSFYQGELFFLKQEVTRQGFDDLAGNIAKAKACQLLDEGRFLEGEAEAKLAVEHYRKDGSEDDAAVANCILACARLMLGDFRGAREAIALVHCRDGKVRRYYEAFESLSMGKRPNLPPGHPLSATPRELSLVRPNSITNQVVRALRERPRTGAELIRSIWGERAEHPSYNDRLYTIITKLRKRYNLQVRFNGSKYELG